jgi:hypothetical protein
MKMMMVLAAAAVLAMGSASWARSSTTGDLLVDECNAEIVDIANDTLDDSLDIAEVCADRLEALDAQGASPARLNAVAESFRQKVIRNGARDKAAITRLMRRCMVRVIGLDEPGLIDQVTLLNAQRTASFSNIDNLYVDAGLDAIDAALATELGD